jgi:retron-type reverse transcriptase
LGGGINGHDFLFKKIIAPENIFAAWREFQKGKMRKKDVLEFAQRVEENLFCLIADLKNSRYVHGKYIRFIVCDPKRREIAKAPVRDRVLHHALCRIIVPLFEPSFVFDSYSSRKEKGIHKAGKRLREFAEKLSRNHTKTVWMLQVDMRKFFDSVDHEILFSLLQKKIKDVKIMNLLKIIIQSYEKSASKGIPLGNLTSQLFSNVYLNLLDNFVKRELQAKYYLRYADDIIILSCDKNFLENCLKNVADFIEEKLKLELHPKKISLKKWHRGIDFLGYVNFSHHSILRTKTKRRMIGRMKSKNIELKSRIITEKSYQQSLQSYLGVLKHCRGQEIKNKLRLI